MITDCNDKHMKRMTEPFEWYFNYQTLKPFILKYCKEKDSLTLYVGGGSSTIPFELNDDGYKRVTTIDYCDSAMELMRRKNLNPDLEFLTMDAKNTNFPSWYFDYILDKACFESEYVGFILVLFMNYYLI